MKQMNKSLIPIVMIFVGMYLIINVTDAYHAPRALLYFLLFIAAIWLSNTIHVTMHELGHLVFAKIAHYDFSSIHIGFVQFAKQEGKVRISLAPSGFSKGQCVMLSNANVTREGHILYYAGGLCFNALTFIILVIILCMLPAPASAFPYGHILLLYNILLVGVSLWRNGSARTYGIYSTDGQMIREFKNDTRYAREYFKIESVANRLKVGQSLLEIDIAPIIDEREFLAPPDTRVLMLDMQLAYYHFAKATLLEDGQTAKEMASFMARHIGVLPPVNQLIHFYELIFYYIHFDYNFDQCTQYYQAVEKVITADTLSCSLRVRAYYAYYMRYNKPEALSLLAKAKELLPHYPVAGLAKYEDVLLDRLNEEIEHGAMEEMLHKQAQQEQQTSSPTTTSPSPSCCTSHTEPDH